MIIKTSTTTALPSNVTVCVCVCVLHSVLVCCGFRRAALLSVCASVLSVLVAFHSVVDVAAISFQQPDVAFLRSVLFSVGRLTRVV